MDTIEQRSEQRECAWKIAKQHAEAIVAHYVVKMGKSWSDEQAALQEELLTGVIYEHLRGIG